MPKYLFYLVVTSPQGGAKVAGLLWCTHPTCRDQPCTYLRGISTDKSSLIVLRNKLPCFFARKHSYFWHTCALRIMVLHFQAGQTPADMATEAGYHRLAERLWAHKQSLLRRPMLPAQVPTLIREAPLISWRRQLMEFCARSYSRDCGIHVCYANLWLKSKESITIMWGGTILILTHNSWKVSAVSERLPHQIFQIRLPP